MRATSAPCREGVGGSELQSHAAAAAILAAVGIAVDDPRLRREMALLAEAMDTRHPPNVVLTFALVGHGEFEPAGGPR